MPDCIATVTVDAANARVQPRTGTSIVGIAQRGEQLTVRQLSDPDSENFIWVQVTIPVNNLPGWIRGDLVQLSGDCADLGGVSTSADGSDTVTPPDPTPPPDPQPEVLTGDCRGEINVFSATVRSGPGLSNAIRGFVNRGTQFIITEISEADDRGFCWYGLDFNGAPGWIREDLATETGDCLDLRTHAEPEPEPDPEPDPVTPPPDPDATASECVAAISLPRVSVREQATTASPRLGMATKDNEFTVKGITEQQSDGFTWTKIDFNGQTGYIRSDLVILRGDCSSFNNDDRLPRPVAGQITQGYRPAHNPTHNGVDFGTGGPQELRTAIPAFVERAHFCPNCTGTPPNIFTTNAAEQRRIFNDAGWGFGFGHHIILRYRFSDIPRSAQEQIIRAGGNSNSFVFVLYAHLSQMMVQAGRNVAADTVFGVTGNTGFSTAEHLHMEVAFGPRWGGAVKIHPAILFSIAKV